MKIDRAIEILDLVSRENHDGIETIREACKMGTMALQKEKAKRITGLPIIKKNFLRWKCPNCKKYKIMTPEFAYCPYCGQRVSFE